MRARRVYPRCLGCGGPEGLFRRRFCRVVVAEQQAARLLVPDANNVLAENRGRAGMVGVVVGVDEVGHLAAHAVGHGDFDHGSFEVVADARGCVKQHHAIPGGHERRVVVAVRDPYRFRSTRPT
jgi:hypothetical protein